MIKKNNDNYPANNDLNNNNTGTQSEITSLQTKQPLFLSIIDKLTPFSMIWVSLVLMYGVICMYTNRMGQDEFYRFYLFLTKPSCCSAKLYCITTRFISFNKLV